MRIFALSLLLVSLGVQAQTPPYTKIDSAGDELDISAPTWTCVRDNLRGLTWAGKTGDGGLHGGNHRYAWFDSDPTRNGGENGGAGSIESCGNTLGGMTCTTENYLAVVNASGYCGRTDWRLPTQAELLSLVQPDNANPAIDVSLFPNTIAVSYWSATTHAMYPINAWGVHFGYGAAHAGPKDVAHAVRLVRGVWSR